MTVSVAMAAYNGGEYITEQIDSILNQLGKDDELVVSVNPSTDNTEVIIGEYAKTDSRVKLVRCEKPGVLNNFQNAIVSCKKDIVFLSDQDDIWEADKIKKQLGFFEDPTIGGVCHGCKFIDSDGGILAKQPKASLSRDVSFLEILKKNPVQGCTLAFRRELCSFFLPFPKSIPMHDSWIGLFICKKSRLRYIADSLLLYRQHDNTVTKRTHGSVFKMIKDRISLIWNYIFFTALHKKRNTGNDDNEKN